MMQIFLEIAYLQLKLVAGLSPSKVNISQESFCLKDAKEPKAYMSATL